MSARDHSRRRLRLCAAGDGSPLPVRPDYLAFGRPDFSEAEIAAVTRVLRSGWIGMGGETIAFEQELARAVGAPHVVTVDTCTSAIFLSLVAEGVGAGDEVITPSLTWCATANAAIYLGARPVFCDVDAETFCVTPESIMRRITARTRAVVIVHYGGYAIDVKALRAALPAHVAIVEDAAHAFGSRYADGTPVGSSGNLTCFSFYANKNLSTGEGGAVALFDAAKAERIARLRQNAQAADAWKRFTHARTVLMPGIRELGYKMNYTDLQAAIGRHQLARQPVFAERRLAIAQRYVRALESMPEVERTQAGIADPRHARHLFVVAWDPARLGRSRNELLHELRARNVGASVHYLPLHLMPYYRDIDPVRLEVTEHLAPRIMTLPIGASVGEADADYVVSHLRELLGPRRKSMKLHKETPKPRAAGETPAVEYGFGGRLTEGFPSQIIVDVTEVCNLACIHCPHPAYKESEHYGARYLDPKLNRKLVDEVRDYGPGGAQYIRYTGDGEPLIHPKGYEMIEYAARNSGVFVTITTNGTIMNEKRTRRLLEAGVHMIDISIDALDDDTYAKVRVNGDLSVTRANVQRLIRWNRESGRRAKVVVSFVEQALNAHEAGPFKAFWEEQGADYVVIRRQHSVAGSIVDISRLLKEKQKGVARRPCVYPWERVVLNPRGRLSFCPADWVHGSELGEYRDTTIREAWSGEFFNALRRAHLRNDYSSHGFCGQCPDWSETRWPHEGRAYADMIAEFQAAK